MPETTLEDGSADPSTMPYGIRIDGTPKRKPGRPPGRRNNQPRHASGTSVGESPYARVVVADADSDDVDMAASIAKGEGPADEGAAKDPEPARGRTVPSSSSRGLKRSPVTLATRKDIAAKLAFMFGLPAQIWASADPICGEVALKIVPEFASDLADIITDSDDLVRWFTAGGGYMKYVKAATTVQPLVIVAWRHHVSHSIGTPRDDRSPYFDPQLYPATATG